MEEQVALINERHESLHSKMEDLYGSIQQHAELFDSIEKYLACNTP